MKTRDQSLDILRGMGIFLMVFDHVGWGTTVHTYIQSFHMTLFFIVSGYLWKNEKLSSLAKKTIQDIDDSLHILFGPLLDSTNDSRFG